MTESELPPAVEREISSWWNVITSASDENVRELLQDAAASLIETRKISKTVHSESDAIVNQAIVDNLADMAHSAVIDPDDAQAIFARAEREGPNNKTPQKKNGSPTDEAPWRHDPQYGGMSDKAARLSWEAAQEQKQREKERQPEPRENIPPAESLDDYGVPATIDVRPLTIAAAMLTAPSQWPQEAPPPIDWLVAGKIPRGDVTTLHGDGGAGKTDIALRLAANVARGALDWLGFEIAHGTVLFISGEEPEREIQRRLWLHAKHDGYSFDELANLRQWFPDETNDTVLAIPDRSGIMRPTPLMHSIVKAAEAISPVLIVADNVAATFAGNQNDRVMVRSYINLWRGVARGPSRPAVLLLDHPSLSGLTSYAGPTSGRGGNMDWRNAVRSALYLRSAPDDLEAKRGVRILETVKNNYAAPGEPLRLEWSDGGLQREHTPSSLHRAAKDAECEETFLRLLDERNAQGSHVGRKESRMYAPKEFAASPNNGGFTRQPFASAMERLFASGKIVEVWDKQRRHDYLDRAPSE